MAVDYKFDDEAYLGQSPNRTTFDRLAYLGAFEGEAFVVCIACEDEAYLGLAPGRTTFSRAAYLGLFELPAVATVATRPHGRGGRPKRIRDDEDALMLVGAF